MSNMKDNAASNVSEAPPGIDDPTNDIVALALTDGEVGALMDFINEFTLGPMAISDED